MINLKKEREKLNLDSNDELFFYWWCEELEINGVLDKFKRCIKEKDSYILSEKTIIYSLDVLKTKTNEKSSTILNPHSYTYDFKLRFKEEYNKLFCYKIDSIENHKLYKSCVFICDTDDNIRLDVKSGSNFKGNKTLFSVNRKWVYEKYGHFINEIQYKELFVKTFTPKKFIEVLNTNNRIIFKKNMIRSLEKFIETKSKLYDTFK